MKRATQTIFLDLDGPVLECGERHYACYLELCARYGVQPLAYGDYWARRRNRIGAAALLRDGGVRVDAAALQAEWISIVEQSRFLELDTCQPGATDALTVWNDDGRCIVLVTLRRDERAVRAQLDRLDLSKFFERIVVCDPELGGAGKAAAAERNAQGAVVAECIWIGDTEVDAVAATTLRCATLYLVTCGIRSEEALRSLRTGFVVRDLFEVSTIERAAGRPL